MAGTSGHPPRSLVHADYIKGQTETSLGVHYALFEDLTSSPQKVTWHLTFTFGTSEEVRSLHKPAVWYTFIDMFQSNVCNGVTGTSVDWTASCTW